MPERCAQQHWCSDSPESGDGYKNSTKIAKEALETGKGVYELVLEHNILSKKDLDTILEPENMIKPVKLDIHPNR